MKEIPTVKIVSKHVRNGEREYVCIIERFDEWSYEFFIKEGDTIERFISLYEGISNYDIPKKKLKTKK